MCGSGYVSANVPCKGRMSMESTTSSTLLKFVLQSAPEQLHGVLLTTKSGQHSSFMFEV